MSNQCDSQQPQEQQPSGKGNKPVETLWDGSVKMAIFENTREHGVSYSTEPGRIYTDQQGNTREAKSFSQSELLKVSRLSDKAYDRINEFKQQRKNQSYSQDRER